MSIDVTLNETPPGLSLQPESKEHRQVQSSIQNWIEGNQSELLRSLNEDHYNIKTVLL